jgi:integrase
MNNMELVQPIRDSSLIHQFKIELMKKSPKEYLLFNLAIELGLKITDIMPLTVWDLKNKSEIIVKEDKTGEPICFFISPGIRTEIDSFTHGMTGGELLFASKKGGKKSMTRLQILKSLNEVGQRLGIQDIGTHTLRKTFGYHHYQEHKDISLLQNIFSHSTPAVTLRYIGIEDMNQSRVEDFFL